ILHCLRVETAALEQGIDHLGEQGVATDLGPVIHLGLARVGAAEGAAAIVDEVRLLHERSPLVLVPMVRGISAQRWMNSA
ncbi:MAG: hypothetical protein IIC27_04705, partial [Chloroflexi bacterium]|nr:hypothetical protein [Chloroflexota bacterium]